MKPHFTMDAESWRRGHDAALRDEVSEPPHDIPDRLAWISGWLEGNAQWLATHRPRVAGMAEREEVRR